MNTNIQSINDRLIIGDCGGLGSTCAIATDTTTAQNQPNGYSFIVIAYFGTSSCSGGYNPSTVNSYDVIFYPANSTDILSDFISSCKNNYFQVFWSNRIYNGSSTVEISNNSFLLATATPNPTSTDNLGMCLLPNSYVDFSSGDIPISTCLPCV